MIFLIHFDRRNASLRDSRTYADSERRLAELERLALEIGQLGGADSEQEIILLEAASEADVRKTHRRYFESLRQIAESPLGAALPS